MITKIQKWGNSLALRIPKTLAEETGLNQDSVVEIRVVAGELHIATLPEPDYELTTLLAAITPTNQHAAIETGVARGNEVW